VRAVVLHHTGGEGSSEQVCRTLRARRLSIHYIIDYNGTVTQHADHRLVTYHAGQANGWTIGIEVVNQARAPAAARHPRIVYRDTVHERELSLLRFTDAQVASCRMLCRQLCLEHRLPIEVPRDPSSGELITRTLEAATLAAYRGVLGHFHLTAKKIDPAPHLLRDITARR
jgi:N-acetyl-anhydromuramyl-L-alanine amidase AmpD